MYKSENPLQTEQFFVKCFVNGLRQEIKHYLKPLKPLALCEAYWMAKDMEKGVEAMAKRNFTSAPAGQQKGGYNAALAKRETLNQSDFSEEGNQ